MRLRRSVPVARVSCTPSMATVPLVGAMSPASIRIVVVLPAPLGPSSATISDRSTSKLTSSTTAREPKRRVRPRAVITSAGRAGGAGRGGGGGWGGEGGGGGEGLPGKRPPPPHPPPHAHPARSP